MNCQGFDEGKATLLIVDDEPINLKVIVNVLCEEYNLIIANNGRNALSILEKNTPSLILLDISMPDMDGFEVCHEIKRREEYKDIPIIFLTAKSGIDDIKKGFEAGVVDYIVKPFNPVEVIARVRNHLNLYHANNELKRINQQLLTTENELKSLNNQLLQLNSEKDKFFSIIGHDLKGVFNGILGITDFLVEISRVNEVREVEKLCLLLNDAANNGYNLLENLLHWARVQTGRIEYNPAHLLFLPILRRVTDLYNLSCIDKEIEIHLPLDSEISVYADKFMLETILRNLISNAIKYSEPGGQITIEAIKHNRSTIIKVIDKGIGIRKEDIGKLFRIETSFSTYGTKKEMGTGLGLILCKEFVNKHDGKIWVESEVNFGSKFFVELPDI